MVPMLSYVNVVGASVECPRRSRCLYPKRVSSGDGETQRTKQEPVARIYTRARAVSRTRALSAFVALHSLRGSMPDAWCPVHGWGHCLGWVMGASGVRRVSMRVSIVLREMVTISLREGLP